MTATVNAPATAQAPEAGRPVDLLALLMRADQQWRQGKIAVPALPADRLAALATAVRHVLAQRVRPRPDSTGLADQPHQVQRELADAQQRAADRETALATAQAALASLEEEHATAQARLAELEQELVTARAAAESPWGAAATNGEPHRHLYECVSPDKDPQPCACTKPWPRTRTSGKHAHPLRPWAALFDRLRSELAESGWTEGAR
jgi:hypothetical protein